MVDGGEFAPEWSSERRTGLKMHRRRPLSGQSERLPAVNKGGTAGTPSLIGMGF